MPRLLLLLAAVGFAGAAFWYFRTPAPAPLSGARAPAATPAPGSAAPSAAPVSAASVASTPAPIAPAGPLAQAIDALLAKLLAGQATESDLAAFRSALLNAPADVSMAAIRAFLATGQDAPAGEGFAVGEGGALIAAPTLRTLLLDLLGVLARRGGSPADAIAIAKSILAQPTSADEWAVALRNHAWASPGDRAYLDGKLREMLAHDPWLKNPAPGLLEALDIAVYSGDPAWVPRLAEGLATGGPSLQRAAGIALDRLAETQPLAVMTMLNAQPALMADRPFLRADYFAKADLANPLQKQAVEIYLTRPDVPLAEKQKLIRGLATPGSFVSPGLLTTPAPRESNPALLRQTLPGWSTRFPELAGEIAGVMGE